MDNYKMTCRPKQFTTLYFGNIDCTVNCYPQQKWEAEKIATDRYNLTRKNIVISLKKEEFEKLFVVI